MSKAGEKLIEAAQSGIGQTRFLNPFTGKTEEYVSAFHANGRMLREAANRINELRAELDALKALLTNPTTGK